MEDNEHSERLVFLQEAVKTKLAVFLQSEFDMDTHKKDAAESSSVAKLSLAKKE